MPATDHSRELRAVSIILDDAPAIDREDLTPRAEFEERARRGNAALRSAGHASGAVVRKVEIPQLADERYPIRAERLERVIEAAIGGPVVHIALLTPRQVIPDAIVQYLGDLCGRDGVVDAQNLYYHVKYGKSESAIAGCMMLAILAVLHPGRLEAEVVARGAWAGRMLGSEADGCKVMLGANEANRTLNGPALNRPIREGDWVHLCVARQRDGLTSRICRSMIAIGSPSRVTEDRRFWMELVEGGYRVGEEAYRRVAVESLLGRL